MRDAARITVAAAGIVVALAFAAGSFGLLESRSGAVGILPEAIAVLILVLASRYRRDRLAVAALIVAAANLLLRSNHVPSPPSTAATALALALAADIGLLTVTRDRPIWRLGGAVWLAVIGLQIWFVSSGVDAVEDPVRAWLDLPVLAPAALAGGVALSVVVFVVRRTAFLGSLVWVAVACTAALVDWRGAHAASLLFAAAQLALLIGLFEDSYRLAYHDELTGLPGRRALDDALRNLSGDFTIAMADVDRFKRFNDRHGHDAGDQVLRMVADELAKVGGGGRAYRYGGEEFALVFQGATVAEVRAELEALRRAVADRSFALRGSDRPHTRPEKPTRSARPPTRVTVTVSIGAAGTSSRRSTADAVLRAADRALYRAKKSGRNRVVAAGDRLPRRR